MANAFSRSWAITRLSFSVIKQDRELLLFPILSGVLSIIFIIAILFPSIIVALLNGVSPVFGVMEYFLLFIAYLVLSFITTFFNVCVVYTTKKRFEGGNATFGESIKFTTSKIHLIFTWALISATLGVILRLFDRLAEKLGGVGEILLRIQNAVLGMMWSLITIFVVPGMVYNNLGPIDAIKKSVEILKKTWGESLIGYYGLGLVEFLFMVVGIVTAVILVVLTSSLGIAFIIPIIFLTVIYLLGVIIIFSVANSIFNTALYVYAAKGKIPSGYNKEIMDNAFRKR
ncbi:hypothetical protein HYX00_02595 [Candidatus Woesearchaeota archaeon]|nr:hypothetical protein [Candidatus Woesearchaeota archaeon]